jgi:hypothetical protein
MWLMICFASPVWIYSVLFWEHTPATALLFGGIILLLLVFQLGENHFEKFIIYSFIAFLFTIAAYLRLETLLLGSAFLFSIFILKKEQRYWLLYTFFLLILTMLLYGILHKYFFHGNPIPLNLRYLFRPMDYLRSSGWNAIPDFLIGPGVDEAIESGWLGGLWSISAILAVAHSFPSSQTKTTRLIRWYSLGLCVLIAIWFLFNPIHYRAAHGLLFTTPWAVLGFTRAREVWKKKNYETRVLILSLFIGLLFYSLVMLVFRGSSPHGGLEWGSRFAIMFYPILAIIAAWDWHELPKTEITLTLILFLIGLGFQIRGLLTIRNDRAINQALNQMIVSIPEDHIVTDLWWFFLNTAPTNNKKAIYTINNYEELIEWFYLAKSNKIYHFSLISLDRSLPWRTRTIYPNLNLQILDIIRQGDIWLFRMVASP